jgi:histone H3/H4
VPLDADESIFVMDATARASFGGPAPIEGDFDMGPMVSDGADDEDEALEHDNEIVDAPDLTMDIGADATETTIGDKGRLAKRGPRTKRDKKISKHGIEYPSLPPAVIKRLAQTFAKTSGVKAKIGADTLAAITTASDWFFEQLGDDLSAYAKHAGRKTIDETDMVALMRR